MHRPTSVVPRAVNAKPALVSLGLALTLGLAAGCRARREAPTAEPVPDAAASASGAVDPGAKAPVRVGVRVREGNVIARSAGGEALFLADEDHRVLRRIPLDPQIPAAALALPGAPAQVLVLDDRILVTVRDPGLLLVLRYAPATGFVELARVALPADAWGLAVTPDESLALVTSAWTHQVSAVDLASATKRWSIDVPREPRAVVIREDGAGAYVTHLVGPNLTRLSDLGQPTPRSSPLVLPAAPHRAPPGRALDASLAYSAVLVDAGERLLVPRHALGAIGTNVWYGSPTVDVLRTKDDVPLSPPHDEAALAQALSDVSSGYRDGMNSRFAPSIEPEPEQEIAQPRAAVYLRTRGSILVAPEGRDRLFELNALSLDPARDRRGAIALGGGCSAPSGLAVSADEDTAYVFCRGSYSLVTVHLRETPAGTPVITTARVVDDALPEAAALGRRIFYDASERAFSGGLACSGCHPEGRDDGHTYYEADVGAGTNNFLGLPENADGTNSSGGYARQTPMLAGRVGAQGPYGWHAQDKDLLYRLRAGVDLHRWQRNEGGLSYDYRPKLNALIAFLRTGLVPPPQERRELTAIEEQGKAIFASPETRCASCHVPATEYTDRTAYPLAALSPLKGFTEDPQRDFKTPSLLSVGGTAPYYHDGSVATLEQLVDFNHDRMGKTNQLTKGERVALVAFLRTL
jgi:DNA-binding beta-propeller fold protein YncE